MYKIELIRISSSLIIGTFLCYVFRELELLGINYLNAKYLDFIMIFTALFFFTIVLINYESLKEKRINFYTDLKLYLYSILVLAVEVLSILIFFTPT